MTKTKLIQKFGTKLLAASKSINKIPTEYMTVAKNCRIFDGSIGPRRGYEQLLSSTVGTNNKGGFIMGGNLYQVANGKIYEINKDTGVQTEKATLPYNARVDILVYKDFTIIVSPQKNLEVFNGEGLETTPITVPFANTGIIEYTRGYSFLVGGSGLLYNLDQLDSTQSNFFGTNYPDFYTDSQIQDKDYWMRFSQEIKQSFTIAESVDKLIITLKLAKVGSPTDNIEVGIYKTSDDTQVGTTQSIVGGDLGINLEDSVFTFNAQYSITTDQAYYMTVKRTASLSVDNYYMIGGSEIDVYDGGKRDVYHNNYLISNQDVSNNVNSTRIEGGTSSTGEVQGYRQVFTIDEVTVNPVLMLNMSVVNSPSDNLYITLNKESDDSVIDSMTIEPENIDNILFPISGTLSDLSNGAYYFQLTRTGENGSTTHYYSYSARERYIGAYYQMVSGNAVLQSEDSVPFMLYHNTPTWNEYGDLYFRLEGVYTTAGVTGSLFISRPIVAENPEYAYDFTGDGSQNITYNETIVGLEGTMNGLYIFTSKKVEFLGANALQNVAGSATFISTTLGKSGEPVNNQCIASSGDKIFFITKSLQIQTINYVAGIETTSIGTLSSKAIVGVKELVNTIDPNQPNAYTVYNKKDETIQFHLRTEGSAINDVVIIYDITNDTFSTDTNKNYNYVVEDGQDYYGFSDIDTSIYKDDIGYNDNGGAIDFEIQTQDMNLGTVLEKMFSGFLTAGGCGYLTTLTYYIYIDGVEVFTDSVTAGINPGGDYESILTPFEKTADAGRIYRMGKRVKIKIVSDSETQDFILDTLGTMATITGYSDTTNKF